MKRPLLCPVARLLRREQPSSYPLRVAVTSSAEPAAHELEALEAMANVGMTANGDANADADDQ